MDRSPKSIQSDGSVRVQVSENKLSDNWGSGSTIFEPQREVSDSTEKRDSSNNNSRTPAKPPACARARAPEQKLTIFALRLATLEKTASGLGALGFIWATVVLLGGYAIKLDKTDFWFITTILLIESTRIFSRSRELEWQHQATWSIADAGIYSFRALRSSSHFIIRTAKAFFRPISAIRPRSHHERKLSESTAARPSNRFRQRVPTRTWTVSDVPLLPYAQWVFLSRNISKLLYWLQLLSATACVTLSLLRLVQLNKHETSETDPDKRNQKSALIIFYGLALAEALLFLIEKAYWEWKVIFCKVLEEVNKECELGSSGMVSIKRFFYDAYSRCINGSIFDGLKMDLVSFATELLASDSSDEQLIGARILRTFSTNDKFSSDTLQKIGISITVMERLVEMLNWKDPEEEEIRLSAAEILSKLAGKKRNSLRVAGIPGAMESISSLLYLDQSSNGAADEVCPKNIICDQENYEFSTFTQLGLLILKELARNHDNCGKIGNTRGLLPKIIDFTHAGESLLKNNHGAESQIMTVKRSLQVMKMLASTTGATGKLLRREISEIVLTISNIRDILQYGENHPRLQQLGIEILTSLAFEEDATERIGSTGGILRELFGIFFKPGIQHSKNHLTDAAGEALAMLALDSNRNCSRMLKREVVQKLVGSLEEPEHRINSARILRNLCAYSGPNCFIQLKEVTAAAPTVLKAIMWEEHKLQEVMLGLAAQIVRFMNSQEACIIFEQTDIRETALAKKLVDILKNYQYPAIKVPRMRRFAIELAIWMMKDNEKNIPIFKDLKMEKELESVTETTSELENFNIFSGTVGQSRHSTTIHSLVDTALELLANG